MQLLRQQLRVNFLYCASNQNHLRPRRPPACCGLTPPPNDFFPIPPFTNRPDDLAEAAGDLRSLSRASLQKKNWLAAVCWECAIECKPGLAFGSKKCARHLPSIFCLFALLLSGLYTRLNRHGFPFCALFQSLQYHC